MVSAPEVTKHDISAQPSPAVTRKSSFIEKRLEMFEGKPAASREDSTEQLYSSRGSIHKPQLEDLPEKSTSGSLTSPYSMLLNHPTRSWPRNFSRTKHRPVAEEWTSAETEIAKARGKV